MLYQDTELLRATVSQEIRCVLPPDYEAPPNSYREVQLLIPLSGDLYVQISREDVSLKAGLNRNYKLPPIPAGAQITLRLLPGQGVYACTGAKSGQLSLAVEYHVGDPS